MSFSRSPRLAADGAWTGNFEKAVRDLGPFAATALLGWIVALLGNAIDWHFYALSVVMLVLAWVVGTAAALKGWVGGGTVVASIVFLAGVGLLRQAAGGSLSGVGGVSLLAVLQTALYTRRRFQLAAVLIALAALYFVPIIFDGPPLYPHSGYRGAFLTVVISSIIGIVTQSLVAEVRERAEEARLRERMLVRVNETVQRLFESHDTRMDVCRAVQDIGRATAVFLYEPFATDDLRISASTVDGEATAVGVRAFPPGGLYDAFWSGKPVLVTEHTDEQIGNRAGWIAAGSPSSVLYQPMMKGDTAIGAMIVCWNDVKRLDDPRVLTASLLAHEAAAVISRADLIANLTDEAHTDPLTRLPNRRAWDARLNLAISDGQPVAVALIDLDHFKQFNDTHGHPEGDRLLREAADAWRAELRPTDFLARIGGEEFGLLVFSADADRARQMMDRVRGRIPYDQTCSAGIAFRETGETATSLVERADRALYEAKASGRDQTQVSIGRLGAAMQRQADEAQSEPAVGGA